MSSLHGKVALITGAARGMGAYESRMFVESGARVVLTDVREEGREVARELGDAARFRRHDVTSEADWEAAVKFALAEFGRLDVLVNNAGVYSGAWLEQETLDTFERVLRVNLVSQFIGLRAVLDPMRAAGGGSIVNISSQAGLQGIAGHAAYGASKWGVRGLSKTAAIELGRHGIRVNSVHPGTIDTEMMSAIGLKAGPGNFPIVPLSRVGTVEDVAAVVAYLASDESAYLTGAEIAVDGGAAAGTAPGGFRQQLGR